MESGILSKMRFASLAYQQFLVAVNSDQNQLDQVEQVFSHYFDELLSQLAKTELVESAVGKEFIRNSLDLQRQVQDFKEQFQHFYFGVFKQFKQQQSELIKKDPAMAFKQWTRTFDTKYLQFVQQESFCRDYAALLSSVVKLTHPPVQVDG